LNSLIFLVSSGLVLPGEIIMTLFRGAGMKPQRPSIRHWQTIPQLQQLLNIDQTRHSSKERSHQPIITGH
jgi:hypothetical protein